MTCSDGNNEDADFYYYYSSVAKQYYHTNHKGEKYYRIHPIIIETIEELGSEKASGFCSKITIVDIPFNTEDGWEISEYDGYEIIEENHRTWG